MNTARMVTAIAVAVMRSWRNRVEPIVGGRAQYRLVVTACIAATILLDSLLTVGAARQTDQALFVPDIIYPSVAALTLVIGVAMAGLVGFLLPERGELDVLLATTRASGGISRVGQELPVLAILAVLATTTAVPVTATLLPQLSSPVEVVVTGTGAFLLVTSGLLTGRLLFVGLVALTVRLHGPAVIGRLVAAMAVFLSGGALLAMARPDDATEGRTGAYRVLGSAIDTSALTPITLVCLSAWCAVMLALLTAMPTVAPADTSTNFLHLRRPLLSRPRRRGPQGFGRRTAIINATITSAGRDPTFLLAVCLTVTAPALLAALERITAMPITLFAGYMAVLAGLAAGYVYGANRAVMVLLSSSGLHPRQWFWPQLAATALVVTALLTAQAGVAVLTTDLPLAAMQGTWTATAIAMAIVMALGRLLPVRADSTSWATLDLFGFLLTTAVLLALIRQTAIDINAALPIGAIVLLTISVITARHLDIRRPIVNRLD